MTHITDDTMAEIAVKINEEKDLSVGEYENLQHIQKCEECKKKISFCFAVLDLMKPESLRAYIRDSREQENKRKIANKLMEQFRAEFPEKEKDRNDK